MYIFRDRGVFIDVYKADDKIVTSRAMSLADIDLRNNRTIDIVTTGRIPSLFCGTRMKSKWKNAISDASYANVCSVVKTNQSASVY